MKIVSEHFEDFDSLITTLNKRPNNAAMKDRHSSNKDDSSFSGTKSYDEAVKLLYEGYTDILPKIKSTVEKKESIAKEVYKIPKPIHTSSVVGVVPNVPNAIMGLPNSMIDVKRIPRKHKTLSLIYFCGESWDKEVEYFIEAGSALISAINIIELCGVQTQLSVAFDAAASDYEANREIVLGTLKIKNFDERFSLQKICFPMAHPSMFRRIGFKHMETCGITDRSFSDAYGYPINEKRIYKLDSYLKGINNKSITTTWIHNNGNDVTKIIKKLGVI